MSENYLDGYSGVTEKIKKAMYNVCKEFLYIGFLLDEVSRYQYYAAKGYQSVYDYALQELGFKRSSVKNFIAVFRNFAKVTESGVRTMHLKDSYEAFNYSQLCEMLSLSEAQRSQVKPEMPVREIRQMKKQPKEESNGLPVGQTSGQVISLGTKTVTVRLSEELGTRLEAYSLSSGFSMTMIMEAALKTYFESMVGLNLFDAM